MIKTWKCLNCEKEFKAGDWICSDGTMNHVVKSKEYRTLDAPLDPGKTPSGMMTPIIRGRTVICNIPPPKKVMENGEVRMVGEGSVEFINGFYATSDPEQQYWLDKNHNCNFTEEQWKNTWLTSEERVAEKELNLKAREQRLENDRNELLTQVKQQKGKGILAVSPSGQQTHTG
jgi:hypothetical protein